MTKGTHLLRSALLALLALAVISGGSLAAGDLFDDDYKDCPHKTRLRDGQIADLSVNRDSEEKDEVNVSWSATDPATWGLGANAYSTSLVVILEDDTDTQTKTLSLGSRKTTFDGVGTGTEVTVQMAIVVDTADGDYLISDILEDSIDQSLTKPSFSATVTHVATADNAATEDDNEEVLRPTGGTMYYVGYNENFGNYKEDTYSFNTRPDTARFNIGLAHGGEDDDKRDDVDFDAYILRITDEDGDVVSEGDDVASKPTSYGTTNRLVFGVLDDTTTAGHTATATVKFQNVRLDDGAQAAVFDGGTPPAGLASDGTTAVAFDDAAIVPAGLGLSYIAPRAGTELNTLFAPVPDEHRLFPTDALSSDVTYTITAWAINDDDEVISPVASLKVRPIDERVTMSVDGTLTALADYVTEGAGTDDDNATPVAGSDRILVTEFTVLD
ncbi:MAG: hypothetical protein F4Y80_09165 [Caldilineaceae bacterium SB0665_bin_21]|nr:hypothetical protein [Caldilineaceae bacterium SB0665_bin_21]